MNLMNLMIIVVVMMIVVEWLSGLMENLVKGREDE